jgi:hypothetical protein
MEQACSTGRLSEVTAHLTCSIKPNKAVWQLKRPCISCKNGSSWQYACCSYMPRLWPVARARTRLLLCAYACLLLLRMLLHTPTYAYCRYTCWCSCTRGHLHLCAHFLFLLMKTPETGSACCNIRLKHMKHLKHTRATYVGRHCNILPPYSK